MNNHVEAFDLWIRTEFVDMNTALEEIYFAQADRAAVASVGDDIKQNIVEQGRRYIVDLLAEGNTDEGYDQAYELLGNVGFYMAACRRHDLTEPSREKTSPLLEASGLAMHLGSTLGVAPRFSSSHLQTRNAARNGRYKSFTHQKDEHLFIEYNTRGVLAFMRAADALVRILPLGISHPVSYHLLIDAKNALDDVFAINHDLFKQLNAERFFYCVRPYYKPYRVGQHEYRGANAGDFAGINEIDLLLGLCSANNISYSQLLIDKFLYMLPEDQQRLRDVMRRQSLLDAFLEASQQNAHSEWYQRNLGLFLEVVDAHGHTAAQHHDQLIKKFIQAPSAQLSEQHLKNITASGPPLPVLIAALEKLRDLRTAAQRNDIPSRYDDISQLRDTLN